jgi:hypothetical protein
MTNDKEVKLTQDTRNTTNLLWGMKMVANEKDSDIPQTHMDVHVYEIFYELVPGLIWGCVKQKITIAKCGKHVSSQCGDKTEQHCM